MYISRLIVACGLALALLGVGELARAQGSPPPPRPSAINPALAQSSSPFLQRAARSPVRWRTWGNEAFLEASRTHKLIFVWIGASWCHWCHTMGRECFGNREVADQLNRDFIPIVVDRDLQPDIDRRYQRLVLTLSGRGGWPLAAILTPEGDVIYGGGYFAPDDRDGYPGLKSVLVKVLANYRRNAAAVRQEALKNRADALGYERVLSNEPSPPGSSRPRPAATVPSWPAPLDVDRMVGAILETFDPLYGGFGATPRFTQGPAVEFLLAYSEATGLSEPLDRTLRSLEAMALGAIRDPLTGLFFRYSVDDTWHYPGFEVLLTTNAQMLRAYLHAWQITGNARMKRVAERLVDGILANLSLTGGGFVASLGGEGPDGEEGGFYLWTPTELVQLLGTDAALVQKRFGMEGVSSLPDRPDAYVPLIARSIPEVSRALDLRPAIALERLRQATEKMRKARAARGEQLKDPTLIVSWNALMISSLLEAGRILGKEEAQSAALRALDRILAETDLEEGDVPQVLPRSALASPDQAATLLLLATATLDAFEVEGSPTRLAQARALTELAIQRFWDSRAGGFWDIALTTSQQGLLQFRWKDTLDNILPATNAVALQLLARLAGWTGDARYRTFVTDTLPIFQKAADRTGLLGASAGHALLLQLYRPPRVVIVRADESWGKNFVNAANRTYRSGKGLLVISPSASDTLAEAGVVLPPRGAGAGAWLCGQDGCGAEVESESALVRGLRELGRPQSVKGEFE